jgi:hypothetical protein
MRSQMHITLQPSPTYLFSYIWLAMELVLFACLIEFFFAPVAPLITLIFMGCFGRFYYWLNFSPESGIQTLFIFGVIPLIAVIDLFGSLEEVWLLTLAYAILFVFFGLFRILLRRYHITSTTVKRRMLWVKSFEIDKTKSIEMYQHSRGKKLNFGCILVPIIEKKKSSDSPIKSLLFSQRFKNRFDKSLRIDGIRNPEKALQDIRKLTNEYFD